MWSIFDRTRATVSFFTPDCAYMVFAAYVRVFVSTLHWGVYPATSYRHDIYATESDFLMGGPSLALLYFYRYSRSLTAYLVTPDKDHCAISERALQRFPLHYWVAFLTYITIAPAAVILSLEYASDYAALPVDWFRTHLVALIVSIIMSVPVQRFHWLLAIIPSVFCKQPVPVKSIVIANLK